MVHRAAMKLALPAFQFRFMAAAGNVIFPGNFHPVGTQREVENVAGQMGDGTADGDGGCWLVVGGSGGFGSAARLALGLDRGADTLSVSFDAAPDFSSRNKIRQIGSPGYHRNLAIERALRQRGRIAESHNGDAFDPALRAQVLSTLRERFGGRKLNGLVWALAAPRAVDPRTGARVASALKPLGLPALIKTFAGRKGDEPAEIVEFKIEPGTPEEAVHTQFVMGGGILEQWVEDLLAADGLAPGFTLLSISYRGNPLNEAIYRNGLIGLAKADLEFRTHAVGRVLADRLGGRALSVEGPAVVTEASGGIPGVPLYLALLADVMRDRFENPVASMRRLFREHLAPGCEPQLDDEGLLRMDDRELEASVQAEMKARYAAHPVGATLDNALYEDFMRAYARTRGFDVAGVDYDAEFDVEDICRA
ncbi:MAG: hypothetical protein B7733_19630 [Myxococcales bacterium FL481]|nr:MAG: hypothetical protein B7733_19630 [Myxococcales bacterium FL481]